MTQECRVRLKSGEFGVCLNFLGYLFIFLEVLLRVFPFS